MERAHWWEVKILSYSSSPADIALTLYKMGSHGIYLAENKGLCFHPDFVGDEKPELYAYFPFHAGEIVSSIKEKLPNVEFNAELKSESELGSSHNGRARKIGPYTILPPWETPDPAKKEISLLTGIAFGSGSHPTTRLALTWLGEKNAELNGKKLLDAGAGTGILSVAGAYAGARVIAVDVAMRAVLATLHNVRTNRVADRVKVICADVKNLKGSFNVIVANIITPVLVKLLPHLISILTPGGTLFITGIMKGEEKIVEKAFKGGFNVIDVREADGWIGYEIRKPSPVF